MPDETFYAYDILGKSLIARSTVPVYRNHLPVSTQKPIAYVHKGNSVGIVQYWFDPNPNAGLPELWWGFVAPDGTTYYTPHKQGVFDVSALKAQGVLSSQEKAAGDEEWYMKLVKVAIPVVLVAILGSAAIKGYLSRPSK